MKGELTGGRNWKLWAAALLAMGGLVFGAGAAPIATSNTLTRWIPTGATDLLQFMDGSSFPIHCHLRSGWPTRFSRCSTRWPDPPGRRSR